MVLQWYPIAEGEEEECLVHILTSFIHEFKIPEIDRTFQWLPIIIIEEYFHPPHINKEKLAVDGATSTKEGVVVVVWEIIPTRYW